MNDAILYSIRVDSSMAREVMASLIADLTGGVVARGDVDPPCEQIAADDDYGTFQRGAADPNAVLGWPTLLEMPLESAGREDVVPAVVSLMNGLIARARAREG